ncbi:DUF397 domain-containing protein [Streptomyces sp. NPDC050535]|uniref:DUF397 domain-containing protein n=1 Tax=Streptomyces sp. NPDC050535 TaxID=3365626 RepID=UPI003798845A
MTEVVGPFRKSSHSSQEGNCVEVAPTTTGDGAVRDSKAQGGPLLAVSRESWAAFVTGVQAGEFGRFA